MKNLNKLNPSIYRLHKSTAQSKTYEWYDEVNERLTVVNTVSDEFTVNAEVHESPLFLKKEEARKELRCKTTIRLGKDFIRILAQSL